MLRLKDVPPEQMPEVVRIANQLYEKDQRLAEQDQERNSYVSAAEELGVPKEYLEKAAAELHRQRVVESHDKQQGKAKAIMFFAAALAGGIALVMTGFLITPTRMSPPPRVAEVAVPQTAGTPGGAAFEFENFNTLPETRWTFEKNASTQAQVTYETEGARGKVAVIRIDRFGTTEGKHRANFDSVLAPPTAAQRDLTFDMRGRDLRKVRVYLEQGNRMRWRSDELTIPSDWSSFRINLNNFDRQVREGDRWRNDGSGRPDVVTRVSFKFGDFMNPPSAKGEVRLDNIRFE